MHLKAVKRIARYLIHTPNFGIWYPKRASFNLVGYSDLDYAGDKVDRKSTLVPYPPPKWNTLPPGHVALNYIG